MGFKICVVGCGEHSGLYHGPSYRKYAQSHPGVILAACCDLIETKARLYKDEFGFRKYYTDMQKMLETEKPDAVCLISPLHLTEALASKILQQGYPLLLEKPPGRTKTEVLKLCEIAERKGIPNRVAFNRRYDPIIRELKRLLDKNCKPEEIHDIRYDMFRVNRNDADFSTTAIHGIDAVRFIAGSDYKHIRYRYHELPHLGQGTANIYMDCVLVSGATAHLNICPVSGVGIERVTVNMHRNTFFADIPMWFKFDAPGRLVHVREDKILVDLKGPDISEKGSGLFETCGFYYEIATFFDALQAGRKISGDLRSSVQSLEVAECIQNRSAEYNLLEE